MTKLLKLADIASPAGISVTSLRRLIADGKGPRVVRLGKHIRFAEQDALDWLNGRSAR